MNNANINETERKVLRQLAGLYEDHYIPFAPVAKRARLSIAVVRRACRSLRRKGLARFRNGLWSESYDRPAGSGYGATDAGRALIGEQAARWYDE